jgi:NADP-dependent 3-hydroxy acid dehydrogenase YdfG
MTQQLGGRTALITGGGSGIGRVTPLALAAERCTITVAGRTIATLQESVRQVEAAGGTGGYAVADVTDEEAIKEAVKVAVGDSGRLDFAVNSAGIDGGNDAHPAVAYPNETLELMLDVNVRGMFPSMKHELEQMVDQGSGSDGEHFLRCGS